MAAQTQTRRLREMTEEEKFLYAETGTLLRDDRDMLEKRTEKLEAKNKACPGSMTLSEVYELTALRRGDFEEAENIATERLLRTARKTAQAPVPA